MSLDGDRPRLGNSGNCKGKNERSGAGRRVGANTVPYFFIADSKAVTRTGAGSP